MKKLMGTLMALIIILSLVLPAQALSNDDIVTEITGEYAPGRLIVRFSEEITADSIINEYQIESAEKMIKTNSADINTVQAMEAHGLDGLYIVEVAPENLLSTLEKLSNDPGVEFAELDYKIRAAMTPNDPHLGIQWGLPDINASEAWDIQNGTGITVGVIDSGVDLDHPDLAENIYINEAELNGESGVDDDNNGFIDDISGWNFVKNNSNADDGYSHGTHIAGIVAMVGNNNEGGIGVSYNSEILPLKFMDYKGIGYISDAIEAIIYAVNNDADIITASWGSNSNSYALFNAIKFAEDEGVLLIAAAGNDGRNIDDVPQYPASLDLDNIITVAAIDCYGNKTSYSNWGITDVDLGAPGDKIASTQVGGYRYMSGTSQSVPFVAGVAALVWAEYPDLTYLEVKERILAGVDPNSDLANKTVTGGTLNAYNALVSVNLNQPPIANAGSDQIVSVGELVIFNGSESFDPEDGSFITYNWDFGDDTNASGVVANHTYNTTGNYTVTLTVMDSGGAIAEDTVNVEVIATDTMTINITKVRFNQYREGMGILYIQASSSEKNDTLEVFRTADGYNYGQMGYKYSPELGVYIFGLIALDITNPENVTVKSSSGGEDTARNITNKF